MAFEIFGFEIRKKNKEKEELLAIDVSEDIADSSVVVTPNEIDKWSAYGAAVDGISYDSAVVPPDEVERVKTYRQLALCSEVDEALNEIRNEVFIYDVPGKRAFWIDFIDDEAAPSEKIKDAIADEVANLYNIMDFNNNGVHYFDSWYINGRLYVQKVIDSSKPKEGIKKIKMLDPLNIRKVKWIKKDPKEIGVDLAKMEEWYIYSRRFDEKFQYGKINVIDSFTNLQGIKIRPESIAYADSGLRDLTTGTTIGYLDKAILPYNNLKMMEDALVIFRVIRAPMRRAIYIDVGELQKNKADSYMKEIMARFKNRMTYDPKTGSLADKRNIMSMMEDYWLPRRGPSGRNTEIQNLDGQDDTHILQEVEYYRDKLWRALNVPRSRFGQDAQSFIFGKGIEIQRDEYRFKKFLDKLRRNFLEFFSECLKTQLILKGIIEEREWDDIQKTMFYCYAEDNAFTEWKESEILNNRIATLQAIDPYIGKFFSVNWVRKNVLRQSDEEIAQYEDDMKSEREEGYYGEPEDIQQRLDAINTGTDFNDPSKGPDSVEIGSSPHHFETR